MQLFLGILFFLVALLAALAGVTRIGAHFIEARNPPVGAFATVDDARIHHVHVPGPADAALPPIVFIHGASGNLLDAMVPIRARLEGQAEMLFLDRPGHGWSERGRRNSNPYEQAGTIAGLMSQLGIERAIIVGHSFGGAVAAAFALEHPERTAGLVFLAAASHPWPGAGTSWYYKLTAVPVLGRLFAETVAAPGARVRIAQASACVFAPNAMPDSYLTDAAIELLLRPSAFIANARDVAGLYDHVVEAAPRYLSIDAPTVVITGDRDTVVFEDIHSGGLARDIPGAEIVWLRNMGHKPDWVAPDLVEAAIRKVAGEAVDLAPIAAAVEARIAGDAFGPPEACPDEKPELAAAG